LAKSKQENELMSFDDEDTIIDLAATFVPENPIAAESFDETALEISALTDRGRVRATNQDQFCVQRRARTGTVLASSLGPDSLPQSEEQAWMLTVADGLGGHVSGEVASATAIRTILDFANKLGSWIMRPSDTLEIDLAKRVDLYIEAIQGELKKQAEADPALAGMATTLTTAYIYGSSATIINLGDSRSYLIRGGEIMQITQDHTLGQEMKDKGMSPEQTRPYRNLLTRCLTTGGDPVNVDLFHLSLQSDDQILLCSDGLTDMVTDPAIRQIITTASSIKAAAEQLVTRALYNGGRDNITVVLMRVK
jgi:serine/threonine protein phosphatase PrpC